MSWGEKKEISWNLNASSPFVKTVWWKTDDGRPTYACRWVVSSCHHIITYGTLCRNPVLDLYGKSCRERWSPEQEKWIIGIHSWTPVDMCSETQTCLYLQRRWRRIQVSMVQKKASVIAPLSAATISWSLSCRHNKGHEMMTMRSMTITAKH